MKKTRRKKPGPPPLPEGEKRTVFVGVKVTPAERDQLLEAAGGPRRVAGFLRDAGLAAAAGGATPSVADVLRKLADLQAEVDRQRAEIEALGKKGGRK